MILINLVQWVWTILAFRLIRALRGTQPCFRFLSRMLIRYRNGHLADIFASLINLVQWVRTFFGLKIDGHCKRNSTAPLVLL